MIVLCIRYTLDHHKRDEFAAYARAIAAPVRRAGGETLGYYLPTLLAGATTTALGLIGFADLAAYERYRDALAADPDTRAALARVAESRCIVAEERSFLAPV